MFRKLVLSISTLALLTACNGNNTATNDTTRQSVEYSCAAATAALRTATTFNARLSDATRQNVTRAIAAINPICSQPTTPTLDTTAHAALTGALATLTAAATEAQR